MPISISDVRAKLDLAEPEDIEDTLIVKYHPLLQQEKELPNLDKKQLKKSKNSSLRDSRTKQLNMSQDYIDAEDEAIEKYVEDNWNFIMSPMLEKVEQDLDSCSSLEEYQDKISTTNLPIDNAMTKGCDANTQSFINGLIDGNQE